MMQENYGETNPQILRGTGVPPIMLGIRFASGQRPNFIPARCSAPEMAKRRIRDRPICMGERPREPGGVRPLGCGSLISGGIRVFLTFAIKSIFGKIQSNLVEADP